MVYLQDAANRDTIVTPSPLLNAYLLKVNDNLFVDILTQNAEVNALFNPTKSAYNSGTSQNYGDASSQLLNGFQVDRQGHITLPIIGQVKVEGLTLSQAEEAIQQQADEYLNDATVKVKLLSFKYTVLGEVNSPGVYYNYNAVFTVLDAISVAKGETDYSQLNQVRVLRTTATGKQVYEIDFRTKDFMRSDAFYLLPNDVVYVQADKNKALKVNYSLYSLIFSSISALILLLNYVD
jgi:polysaccharide export outer membrane protein